MVVLNKNKYILLIKNNLEDYITYLLTILAKKIQSVNCCELQIIDRNEYDEYYGKIEIPCILLIKDNKIQKILNGFNYLDHIPKF